MTQSTERRDAFARRIFGLPDPVSPELAAEIAALNEEIAALNPGSFDQGARTPSDGPLGTGAEMNASIREAANRRSGTVRRAERINVAQQAEDLRPPAGSIEEER